MLDLVELATGDKFFIYGLRQVGRELSFVAEFAADLPRAAHRKIDYRLGRTAMEGPPTNEDQSRSLKGNGQGLFEFKFVSDEVRLIYFYGPKGTIIVTHGFTKHGDDPDPQEIDRAIRLKRQYEEGA